LGRSRRSPEELDAIVVALVDRVTRRMRASARIGRTVALRLRFADYSRASRSHTLAEATAATRVVLATARGLLATAMPLIERQGITLVGLSISNLERARALQQLSLPLERRSAVALDAVLDAVRDRFGPSAVTRAVLLGRGASASAWLSPDE
jgi:DNA polymerase-4